MGTTQSTQLTSRLNSVSPYKYECSLRAAQAGDLDELIKMKRNNYSRWKSCQTQLGAAERGHLDIIIYFLNDGCLWSGLAMHGAGRSDHVHIIKYFYERGYNLNYAAINAIAYGKINALKYCCENGYQWDDEVKKEEDKYHSVQKQIEKGKIDFFKYCLEQWYNNELFWSCDFKLDQLVKNSSFDLDDPVWRKLIYLDHSKYPLLKEKVEQKKQQLNKIKNEVTKVLYNYIELDVIKYCIHLYI